MADGRDDNFNMPAKRGSRLRNVGDELGNKPEYSDGLDWSQGGPALNKRTKMDEAQHNPTRADHDLRGETGLIFKEPLS